MKRLILIFLSVLLFSCNNEFQIKQIISDQIEEIKILPSYDNLIRTSRQVDLRNKDLSNIRITNRRHDLYHSVFDNYTIWPETKPDNFSPLEILNNNYNPGLNISELHKKGINGSGVKIAIIDLPISFLNEDLDEGHISIQNTSYVAFNSFDDYFHGHAILSILAGKHSGVAPGAEIVYIKATGFDTDDNFTCLNEIDALQYVIDYNQSNEDPIDAVTISSGANKYRPYYDDYLLKITELEKAGIPVISPIMQIENEEFHFYGLKRKPMDDPNDVLNYTPVEWNDWIFKINSYPGMVEEYEASFHKNITQRKTLLLPLDPKTYSGYRSEDHYIYSFIGGWSWLPPYIAGLFALAKQVQPDIKFNDFWSYAFDNGHEYQFVANGKIINGSIINPELMIEKIKADV